MEINKEACDLVKKSLGKSGYKHRHTLLSNAAFVANGFKPSYLLDCCSIDAETMCSFVQHLNALNWLNLPLQVVALDEEVFITNVDILSKWLKVDAPHCPVVDVSVSRGTPAIIETEKRAALLQDVCESILKCLTLNANYEGVIRLELPDSVNRTTVFGLLLGYPVLYWYEADTSRDNCLSMQPLVVSEISLKMGPQRCK